MKLVEQVFGRSEFAGLHVARGLRLDDSEQKGFKLFQVLVADGEIRAESVPMRGEPVLQVRVQAPAKVTGQPRSTLLLRCKKSRVILDRQSGYGLIRVRRESHVSSLNMILLFGHW